MSLIIAASRATRAINVAIFPNSPKLTLNLLDLLPRILFLLMHLCWPQSRQSSRLTNRRNDLFSSAIKRSKSDQRKGYEKWTVVLTSCQKFLQLWTFWSINAFPLHFTSTLLHYKACLLHSKVSLVISWKCIFLWVCQNESVRSLWQLRENQTITKHSSFSSTG